MAFSLSSLDVHYLVRELRPVLEESFVDKAYESQEEKGDFLLRLRNPKAGKQQLYLKVPEAFFLTEHRYSWPQQPPGFCMQLRKQLGNSQVESVRQHGFERIVEIVFRKGETRWRLIVELFSKGNVVLVNEEGLIRGVMDLQRWKDRTLRVNAPYEYPPGAKRTPELSLEELSVMLSENDRELVRFCATALGLGGKYAEELVARAGIEKSKVSLSGDEIGVLHGELMALFDQELRPVTFDDDAAPFPLRGWDAAAEAGSFSSAIESLVVAEKTEAIEQEAHGAVRKVSSKYERIVTEQTAKLEGYRKAAEENQRKGEYIYERYQELSGLLDTLKGLREKGDWPAVKSFVKENSLPIKVDERKGVVVLEVSE